MLRKCLSAAAVLALAAAGVLLTAEDSQAQVRWGVSTGRGGSGVSVGNAPYGGNYGRGYGGSGYYGRSYYGYPGGYGYGYSPNSYGYGSRSYYYPGSYYGYGNNGYAPRSYWYGAPSGAYYGSYPSSRYSYGAVPSTNYYWGDSGGYYGAAPAADQRGTAVTVDVRLPDPNAEVWFEGTKTDLRGAERQFVSPPLDPARSYSYDIRARWMENGTERTDSRSVDVQAGQRVLVDFTRPERPARTEEFGTERAEPPRRANDRGADRPGRQPQPEDFGNKRPEPPRRTDDPDKDR